MSNWRRKAIDQFPDLRTEFQQSDATIYTVFFELLPRCLAAHKRGDASELAKIYAFAEWCMGQEAKNIWNAAGVAFYEHLGDDEDAARQMSEWVSPGIFHQIESLLASRMPSQRFHRLKQQYSLSGEDTSDAHEKSVERRTRRRGKQPGTVGL